MLEFQKLKKGLKVNAQGLHLVWRLNPKLFPIMRWVLSIDEENNLYKDPDDIIGCSAIYRNQNDISLFSIIKLPEKIKNMISLLILNEIF